MILGICFCFLVLCCFTFVFFLGRIFLFGGFSSLGLRFNSFLVLVNRVFFY